MNGELLQIFPQCQKGPIWSFVIYLGYNISETVRAMTNVAMEQSYKSYDLSVDLMTFDIG